MNTTILSTTESSGSDAEEPGSSTSGDVPPEPGPMRRTAESDTTIEIDAGDLPVAAVAQLRTGLDQVIPLLSRPVAEISIRIVGDREMTELHARWKHSSVTTDVVTFDLSDSPSESLRVDLAICIDEATRQSENRGHQLEDELLLYVIHGLLHCCGHDDQDEESAAAMHAEEDRLLQAIGRDAIYRRRERS